MSCISPTSRQPLFVVVFLSRASTGNRETPASPATDDVIFIIPQALFPRLRWFPNIRSGAVPSEVRKTVKLSASTHSVSSFRFNCLRPQLSLNTTSHQQKKNKWPQGRPATLLPSSAPVSGLHKPRSGPAEGAEWPPPRHRRHGPVIYHGLCVPSVTHRVSAEIIPRFRSVPGWSSFRL